MCKEVYEALNRLATKFQQTVGTDGQATELEAAQITAEYINALAERLSTEDLVKTLDDYRAGRERMKTAIASLNLWQETEEGQLKSREFKRFITEIYTKISPVNAG